MVGLFVGIRASPPPAEHLSLQSGLAVVRVGGLLG